jgi:hypothetical protein
VDGEERAVAAPGADGVDGGQRPVGAGPEVQVADELVAAEGGQGAEGGDGEQAQRVRLAAADGADRKAQHGQDRHGGQVGGGH